MFVVVARLCSIFRRTQPFVDHGLNLRRLGSICRVLRALTGVDCTDDYVVRMFFRHGEVVMQGLRQATWVHVVECDSLGWVLDVFIVNSAKFKRGWLVNSKVAVVAST